MSATIAINDVEIAHLKLSYAHTRIRRPRQILELSESLLRCGQLLPIVVVAEDAGFVLIDGYQRVEAARRAGLDSLQAQIWPSRAPDAVCQLLASDGARQFDVWEQAALLRELKLTHRLSQNEIALRMGRHPSWVSRRLMLIEQLPASAMEAVRAGWLSTWSASRCWCPWRAPTPSMPRRWLRRLKTMPSAAANCSASGSTTRRPTGPCARRWRPSRSCFLNPWPLARPRLPRGAGAEICAALSTSCCVW